MEISADTPRATQTGWMWEISISLRAVEKGNKHVCHFDTIHEVCEYMGIDEANLKETIAKYNKAKEDGYDPDFHTDPFYIAPVHEESGHIYCFRIFPGGSAAAADCAVAAIKVIGDTSGIKADRTANPLKYYE